MPRPTIEEVTAAVDKNVGFCIMCGNEAHGVEPDARNYKCESCGAEQVFGAEQILIEGLTESKQVTLQTRMVIAVNELRELAKEYHLKDENEQKRIRHQIYTSTGGFGKLVTAILPQFKDVEDKLINQNKA